jgi:hypothetical protein
MKFSRPPRLTSRFSSRNGQSLIEVIVAITALTVSFLGISALLSQSLALNRVTTNELTATYLASEGIEVTKNLIDHDVYAQGYTQATGWGTCFPMREDLDKIDDETDSCSAFTSFTGSGAPLLYDADTHLYGYEEGTPTGFTREIKIVPLSPYEIQVDAIVRWLGLGGGSQEIDLQDDFYAWNATTTP